PLDIYTLSLHDALPISFSSTPVSANSPAAASPDAGSPANNLRKELRVWTRDLLIAIGLALVIIVFLYQPVKVEGTSMAPLLSDQDRKSTRLNSSHLVIS